MRKGADEGAIATGQSRQIVCEGGSLTRLAWGGDPAAARHCVPWAHNARRSRGSDGGPWHAPALQPRRQRSCVFVGLVAENQYLSSVFPSYLLTILPSYLLSVHRPTVRQSDSQTACPPRDPSLFRTGVALPTWGRYNDLRADSVARQSVPVRTRMSWDYSMRNVSR